MIPLEQMRIVLLLISYFLRIVSVSYFTQRAITSDAITEATLTIVDACESLKAANWLYFELSTLILLGSTYTTSFCWR